MTVSYTHLDVYKRQGLGLSLVAALVWQAGGEVELANRDDGRGVAVCLHLPLPPILNMSGDGKAS